MSYNVVNPYQTFYDSVGQVRSGGIVTFYDNKTTNLAAIFSDEDLIIPQTNPYTLDASGRIVGDVKFSNNLTMKVQNADLSDPRTDDDVVALSPSLDIFLRKAANLSDLGDDFLSAGNLSVPYVLNTKDQIAALTYTSADAGRKVIVSTGVDKGMFTVEFNATPGTYSDNGGAYTGTVFIPSGGDGTIGFVRDFSGAINVKWFGAVGDDSNDDTISTENAIDASIIIGNTLYFPSGIYLCTLKITKSITATRKGLRLLGEGSELSVIKWNNSDGGFNFTLENGSGAIINGNKLILEGLSLTTSFVGGGTALYVDGGNDVLGEATEGVTINDVVIRPDTTTSYWNIGTHLVDSTKTNIHQYGYLGLHPAAFAPANMVGTGLIISGGGDHFISDSRISFFDKAIDVQGVTEGVYLSNVALVAGNYGVYWVVSDYPTDPEALLSVTNCHINTYYRAIKANNVFWIDIKGGLTLQFDAGVPAGPYIGIELAGNTTLKQRSISLSGITINLREDSFNSSAFSLTNCSAVRFNGVSIENNSVGYTGVNGIQLAACADVSITGCQSSNVAGHISINEQCSNVSVNGNNMRKGDVGVAVAGTASNRAQNIVISSNNFAEMAAETMDLDSVNKCTIVGNNDSGSPVSGSFITKGTHASKGSYTISDNNFHTAAPALYDTASTYTYGRNTGLITDNYGTAGAVADGNLIAHGLFRVPSSVYAQTTVAGDFVSATAAGATNFTAAIKRHDGTSGTTQNIYWRASV